MDGPAAGGLREPLQRGRHGRAPEAAAIQNERLEGITARDKDSKDAKTMGAPRTETKKEDPIAARKKQFKNKPPILLGYWKIRGLA